MKNIKLLSLFLFFSCSLSFARLTNKQYQELYDALETGDVAKVALYKHSLTEDDKADLAVVVKELVIQRVIECKDDPTGLKQLGSLIVGLTLLGIDVIPFTMTAVFISGVITWPLAVGCGYLTFSIFKKAKRNIADGLWGNYNRKIAYQRILAIERLLFPKSI